MSPVRASDGWRRKKGSVRHKAKSRVYILKDDPKWDVAEIVERGVYERLSVGNGSVVPENLSSERSRALTEHASCTPENTLYGKISVSSNPASEGIFSAGSGGPENLQVEVVENFTRVSPPLSVPNLRSHHGSHNSKVLVKQASFNPSRRSKAAPSSKAPSNFLNFSRDQTQRVIAVGSESRPAHLMPVLLAGVEPEKNSRFKCTRHWMCIGGLFALIVVMIVTYNVLAFAA